MSHDTEQEAGNADATRRSLLALGAVGTMLAGASVASAATPAKAAAGGFTAADRDLLDRLAIAEMIQRERSARDGGLWDVMAACYHPDAHIETSWYKGDGAGFVAATKRNMGGERLSLHHLSPSVVTLGQGRALADSDCQLLAFAQIDGVDISIVNHTRILWRVQKLGDRWLIAGLNMIYVRDTIMPCNPAKVPHIDDAEAARYRRSYRYLSYLFARTEHPARDDLPGIDKPETVVAIRAADAAWLKGA